MLAATHRRTGQVYALKIIDQSHLTRFNKVKYAYVEKDSLARLSTAGHPGVVRLHWAFRDTSSLCEFDTTDLRQVGGSLTLIFQKSDFVLDLVPNGELVTKINKVRLPH